MGQCFTSNDFDNQSLETILFEIIDKAILDSGNIISERKKILYQLKDEIEKFYINSNTESTNIVLLGDSECGKSSLINAYISSIYGKTIKLLPTKETKQIIIIESNSCDNLTTNSDSSFNDSISNLSIMSSKIKEKRQSNKNKQMFYDKDSSIINNNDILNEFQLIHKINDNIFKEIKTYDYKEIREYILQNNSIELENGLPIIAELAKLKPSSEIITIRIPNLNLPIRIIDTPTIHNEYFIKKLCYLLKFNLPYSNILYLRALNEIDEDIDFNIIKSIKIVKDLVLNKFSLCFTKLDLLKDEIELAIEEDEEENNIRLFNKKFNNKNKNTTKNSLNNESIEFKNDNCLKIRKRMFFKLREIKDKLKISIDNIYFVNSIGVLRRKEEDLNIINYIVNNTINEAKLFRKKQEINIIKSVICKYNYKLIESNKLNNLNIDKLIISICNSSNATISSKKSVVNIDEVLKEMLTSVNKKSIQLDNNRLLVSNSLNKEEDIYDSFIREIRSIKYENINKVFFLNK